MSDSIMFQCSATLKNNGIATRSDGTIDCTFNLQEMSVAYVAALHSMRGKFGQIAFISQETPMTDEQLDEIEIPETSPDYKGQKSKSQVMRGKLYKLWVHLGSKDDFELFYSRSMDRFINTVEEKMT